MEGIKDVMNSAVNNQGATSKRIAGDAGREYFLQKDAVPLADEKKSSSGLQPKRSSGGSGALGKPPLPPNHRNLQVLV